MQVSFFGRLTRDAEVKTTKAGTEYTQFAVAVNLPNKEALFVDVSAWGRQGETIQRNFRKGSRIVVYGELREVSPWLARDGSPRASVRVSLNGFDFVDTKAETGSFKDVPEDQMPF